ncbi:DUF1178 family protein [Aurantiacibacter luteus]|uniref:Uncharacterized protein n=1 Tax=Aurantiacibacter luteus TaxID=1581420 RepID=A0A0G9MXG0_9SPHN|nr:DUF1178 family protein [Aurantiacibacter luteus]KLE35477.1 hypothetical protein AAW00_03355 [Aurantiacibacter luteus]
MIVYDLTCDHGHRFEGWFGSSADFASQAERGLLACPACGSVDVTKAPMAPAVPRKGNRKAEGGVKTPVANAPLPPEVAQAMARLAEAQARALKDSTWVGKDFAEASRAMHYGEREHQVIHGQASVDEAKALVEEGVPVSPLPFPVAPPEELN